MTRVFVILAALGAATIASPALADDDARLSVGITGGTLGIGPEIGYRLSKNFGVRANASFLSISHNIDSDNITYDGKVKLQSGGAMVDVYPFGGGFRVSGGVRINGNKARGIGTPTGGTFDINGTSYDATTLVTSVRRHRHRRCRPRTDARLWRRHLVRSDFRRRGRSAVPGQREDQAADDLRHLRDIDGRPMRQYRGRS